MRSDVVALYVDRLGPYPKLVEDWYSEDRPAERYWGPLPIVAHPPCGPWGRMKFLCTKQDPSCALHALEVVRRVGGVLEHPQHSTLWRHSSMPVPGAPKDKWGGYTVEVNQCDFGHRCKKATWIYIVRCTKKPLFPTHREFTHRITNGSRGDTTLPRVGSLEARLTPVPFAKWLINLAASVSKA